MRTHLVQGSTFSVQEITNAFPKLDVCLRELRPGIEDGGGGGVEPENVEAKTPRQPHRAGKSLVNS
jgi:hypothetical protein